MVLIGQELINVKVLIILLTFLIRLYQNKKCIIYKCESSIHKCENSGEIDQNVVYITVKWNFHFES